MIAAGTQATDGRHCSPLTIGPIAARSQRLHHIASPSRVPMTSDIGEPDARRGSGWSRPPRRRCRPAPSSQNVAATSAGDGSAYDGLTSAT